MPSAPQHPEHPLSSLSDPSTEIARAHAQRGGESKAGEDASPTLSPENIMRRARLRSFPQAGNVTPFPAPIAVQDWVVESQVIEGTGAFGTPAQQGAAFPQSPQQDPELLPTLLEEPAPQAAQAYPTMPTLRAGSSEPEPSPNTALVASPQASVSATSGYAIADLPDSAFRKLSQLEA